MVEKKSRSSKPSLKPRLRVMLGGEIALGPGRIDLLELIQQTGSLRAAAERMGLSYMRAWQLIKYTNRCFQKPVVQVVRGGKHGGGATLTETGRRTLAAYRLMEKKCQRAMRPSWTGLQKLLAK